MRDYDPNFKPVKKYFLCGTKAVVFNDKNQILLMRRSAKCPSRQGGWDFPGGGLEYEDPAKGIKREIYEETLLEISEVTLVHSVHIPHGDDQALILGYKAFTNSKEVDLSWEHDKYVWVDPKDIEEYNLPDMHSSFVEKSLE